jgi:DNA-binding response OmpR family regulator
MDKTQKKILIVEDDTSLLNTLADRLVSQGFSVMKAEDGKRAIDSILHHKPGLILLDLLIPEVDGYQVLQTVRTHGDPHVSATPVIVLSNLWSDKDILKAKALRVSEYYVKAHTNLEDVYKKISELISS